MSNKNFSDLLASGMLTKLASKENRFIFGSEDRIDFSFAKDGGTCKNCKCRKDDCKCGDMAWSDDAPGSPYNKEDASKLAEALKDFNDHCDGPCEVCVRLSDLGVVKCEDLTEEDAELNYSKEFELPGKENALDVDFEDMAKSALNISDKEEFEDVDEGDGEDTDASDLESGLDENEAKLKAAASYLLDASDALDSAGFDKSASAALSIAKYIVAAAKNVKNKKMLAKTNKSKKNSKEQKKETSKNTKKQTSLKSTKSTDNKEKEEKTSEKNKQLSLKDKKTK